LQANIRNLIEYYQQHFFYIQFFQFNNIKVNISIKVSVSVNAAAVIVPWLIVEREFGDEQLIHYICTPIWYTSKYKHMKVISTREFRENQGQYLGMAKNGEDIVLKSRAKGSFKIVPITEDDTLMSKKEFFAKIDRGLQEAKEGKGTVLASKEDLMAYFENL
jgi:hypothetical protein